MLSSIIIPILAFGSLGAVAQKAAGACQDVHMFLARGAGDPYPGPMKTLIPTVCAGLSSCDYEDILYVGGFPKVCSAVTVGIANATKQMNDYAARCPSSQLVLCGYSEGSSVALNTLGGGGTACPDPGTMPATPAMNMTSGPGKQIKAVVIFGDIRHTANQTYNYGTAPSVNGLWPRTADELKTLNVWSDMIRSWCDVNDPVCAGGSSLAVHTSYMDRYTTAATTWIRDHLNLTAAH